MRNTNPIGTLFKFNFFRSVIMEEIERWYNLEEIANHLGVSKDTIRSYIKKGTIPFYKVGRQYKFKLSEVDAWVESGQSADADK